MGYSDTSTPSAIAPKPELLIRATDSSGRTLRFAYNADAMLISMTNPAGETVAYRYDAESALLAFVDYPDGYTREYRYNEDGLSSRRGMALMTGIIDKNGARYATYRYDSSGRAIDEWHGTAFADRMTVAYGASANPVSHATLTDALGATTIKHFVVDHGIVKDEGVSRPCSTPGCTGAVSTLVTYNASGLVESRTDFKGNTTRYDYDGTRGLVTRQTDAWATPAERATDTNWNPVFRKVDQRVVSGVDGAMRSMVRWAYNAQGQPVAHCAYDPADPAALSVPCSAATAPPVGMAVRRTKYTYCESAGDDAGSCPIVGLMLSMDGPRTDVADVTTYDYYETDAASCGTGGACLHRHGDLWKTTNALGQVTEVVRYDGNGRPARVRDPNGTLTDYVYSPRGWLTDRIVRASADGASDPADAITHTDYDGVGNVVKVTEPDGAYLAYTYDDAHRLTDVTDAPGNAIHYTLDAAGNRTGETTTNATAVVKRCMRRIYDQLSRLKQSLNAANQPVFDATDGYDDNGNLLHSTDGNGVVTAQQFDPLDRLIATIQDVGGTDPATADATTQYTYDALDQLRAVTDPNGLTTGYTYDALGNLTELDSPDTGISHYAYDAAGNRTSQLDARGITTTYTYDALNRVTAIAYPDNRLNVTYAYDEPNSTTGCNGSHPVGHLTTMTDGSGSTRYCYDRRGNVIRKTQQAGAADTPAVSLVFTYDKADRLQSIRFMDNTTLVQGRDASGRLVSLMARHDTIDTSLVDNIDYLPFGPATRYQFGALRLDKTYDADYRITGVVASQSGYPDALAMHYGSDAMGNILGVGSMPAMTTPEAGYGYDALGRLRQVWQTAALSREFTYNATGDRLTDSPAGQATQAYTYQSGSHRLITVGTVARQLDAAGHTTAIGGMALRYNDAGRLTGKIVPVLQSTAYHYNGKGERVAKESPQPYLLADGQPTGRTVYVYLPTGQLAAEYAEYGACNHGWGDENPGEPPTTSIAAPAPAARASADPKPRPGTQANAHQLPAATFPGSGCTASGDILARVLRLVHAYAWADGVLVAVADPSAKVNSAPVWNRVLTDHLNTPRTVVNANGQPIWRWPWQGNAFGELAPDEDPDHDSTPYTLNLRFPGQYFDAETGLHYNYFRDYEPGTGRYAQPDPLGDVVPGLVQRYPYANQNPWSETDPFGLYPNVPFNLCPAGLPDCGSTNFFAVASAQRWRKVECDADASARECVAKCTLRSFIGEGAFDILFQQNVNAILLSLKRHAKELAMDALYNGAEKASIILDAYDVVKSIECSVKCSQQ